MDFQRRRRRLTVGMVLAVVAALSVVSTTLATFPGQNGSITFMRQDENGFWQTWVARADLSHERQLTNLQANSGWPAWSPDGSRIAINSDREDPDRDDDIEVGDIFSVRPDGSGLVKLTGSVGYAGAPAYSPDGRLIAFEADRGAYPAKAGIYVMNAKDGRHVRRITSLPAGVEWDGAPRFSPDGKRLVFTRYRLGFTRPNGEVVEPMSALHVVKLNGSSLRRITPWSNPGPGDADWSPDGTKLVFEQNGPIGNRGDAWVVGEDGRGLRNLTKDAAVPHSLFEGFLDPVWSPDGKLILLGHERFSEDEVFTAGLATIHPDGSHLHYVKGEGNFEHQPDWGRASRH
jgi:Tol biopolymer transport system component